MKTKTLFAALALAIGSPTFAAETPVTSEIVLRGVLDLGETKAFSLSSPGGQSTDWAEVGDDFLGYEILSYDAEQKTLTVSKGDETFLVGLAGMEPSEAEATLADARAEAEAIMETMRFQETIRKMLDGQRQQMADMMRQQAAQAGVEDEELLAFQDKAMGEMFEEIDWASIEEGMVDIYAEVFTPAELSGINEFYTTPAGQATITKAPELQVETMEIMMPQIMQASGNMQRKMQQFLQERDNQEAAD